MNHLISTLFVIVCIVVAFIINSQVFHWFLLPISICGIILGNDALAWLRGRLDTFDVKGVIGIFGIYFFFLSPIIFIASDLNPVYADLPKDWRPWIGLMGIINTVSIILYKIFEFLGQTGRKRIKTSWQFDNRRSVIILAGAIAAAILSQAYVLIRFGGFAGIATAQFGGDASVFAGAGIPRLIADSAPILCVFAFLLLMRHTFKRKKNLFVGLILLTLFSCIVFVLSGLYSARGTVVTSIIWTIILFHYFWRPITPKFLLIILTPLLVINWVFAFYKDLGPKVIDYVQKENAVQRLEKKTGRTLIGTIVGDLSRVDVQAYMLYRLLSKPDKYNYRYGRTYLEDFTPIIPYWIWPNKPANSGKVLAGTELLWGKGFYKEGVSYLRSNRAYGLGGEMMLNFGFFPVPIAYAIWGFVVGRFRRYVKNLSEKNDLRFFIMPYFIWFIPNMLIWDLDNWVAHSVTRAAFPILIVWLMSSKVRI